MNTNKECEHKKIKKYRDYISIFLQDWYYDWEWYVSHNTPTSSIVDTEKYLKLWGRKCSKKYKIQICYQGIFVHSKYTGNHVHLLMLGKNKEGSTLFDMNEHSWEREWNDLTHKDSLILPIKEEKRENGFNYISGYKNTPINHFDIVDPYNIKLLKKTQKIQFREKNTEKQIPKIKDR